VSVTRRVLANARSLRDRGDLSTDRPVGVA
jgi:hypothetical protein